MQPFPLIEISGPPYERGVQFGRACGDLIRRYPSVLRQIQADESRLRGQEIAPEDLGDAELGRRARVFLPWFEEFAPEQIDEIRGVAVGAEVPFETALLVNVRAEVFGLGRHISGCTAIALGRRATADGGVLIGQNQDQHPLMQDLVVILRVIPHRGPRMLMATFGGLLGYGGINSDGIGYMMNALANGTWRMGMPHYPVKRTLLEQSDIDGCLQVFDRAKVGSCGNNLLVDRQRLADVELTPDGYSVIEPDDRVGDFLAHTNHFHKYCSASEDRLLTSIPDSTNRCARAEALVQSRHGHLGLADLKAYFADHDGYPNSICRHITPESTGRMKSIYSVIGEPDRGLLHVSVGNPCESEYATYAL